MGLTISNITRRSIGDEWEVRANAIWNAVYATNGASLTPESLGLMSISHLEGKPKSGYLFEWVPSTSKLKVFRSAVHTPVGTVAAPTITAGTGSVADPLAVATGAIVKGTGAAGITGVQAPAFTGTEQAQLALAEVTNGATLSSTPGSFIIVARGLGL